MISIVHDSRRHGEIVILRIPGAGLVRRDAVTRSPKSHEIIIAVVDPFIIVTFPSAVYDVFV